MPTGSGLASRSPVVNGTDFMIAASDFKSDRTEVKESSFKKDLTLPPGSLNATFISDPTRAPQDFTDLGPRWSADEPPNTTVSLELRTGPDGKAWDDWQPLDEEDVLSAADTPTQTYGSMVSVDQKPRFHRYVQTRVTLHADKPGLTPTFHEITYTFINAGITQNPPKPQAMALGTPSDAPRPALVSRNAWGAPEGESSPSWTPKFRRVTNIIIHHTATSNADTDFAARVRAIWYFHAHTRGWGDIGYNYLIDPNGVIYEGRAGGDDVEAGHAYPFNSGSMGIGMIGNFMRVAPSATAQAALIDLISWKSSQRGIDPLGTASIKGVTDCGGTVTYIRPTIAGHRDFKGTACGKGFNTSTCPGDKLYSMLPQIRASIVADQPPLRAVFTGHDTPGNIAPGASLDVHLTVRNSGSLTWQSDGQGAVSIGYRWLTPGDQPIKGWKDVKTPLERDVPFADTITVTAKLNAPTVPGHYALVWDLIRDGQGWFQDEGSAPLRVDVVVGKGGSDTVPPQSTVLPLPVYSNDPQIPVRWTGNDDPKGSGVVSFDIQYRIVPQGPWTDWKLATADTQAIFEGQDGYTYGFRSRARDAAGNVEAYKEDPDTYTSVDTRPPPLAVDTPLNGANVDPGALLVRGRTEPGIFVAVNDKRAEEANGVFTSTVDASGRDFVINVTAADPAGNVARLEITVQAAARYNDVPASHPAFNAIEYLSAQGIVSGYGDGTFRPDVAVTRAQLVKTLGLAMHWGLISPQEGRFSDVPPDSWMYPYVETAAARQIMDGFPDGTFHPNIGASRAAAIYSLARAAGWKTPIPKTSHFLDVKPRAVIAPYLEAAYAHGVVTPDPEGHFNPNAPTTRATMSIMVYQMLTDLVSNTPNTPDDQGP
ncbi:MAG: S-layer homology domain-containing protein [Chloroflexia bacterium]